MAISECPCGSLHVNSDYGVLELVAKNNSSVSSQSAGTVIGTSLYCYSMPLLRYEVGDFVQIDNGKECACRCRFPVVRSIDGRQSEVIITPEGEVIPNRVLLVCGFWGQGPIVKVLRELSNALPHLKIDSVCGENVDAYHKVRAYFGKNANVRAYGVVASLAPFLKECGSVITKPGIATLIESHAARRKIFLLKGMPVAEDNNARFATRHLGAQWFDLGAFKSWHAAQ